ncbi:hypothetical protein LCGC14_2777200, partial [marine sediment metagenome]
MALYDEIPEAFDGERASRLGADGLVLLLVAKCGSLSA